MPPTEEVKKDEMEVWETARVDETKDYTGVTKIFGYGSMVWKPPVPAESIKAQYPAIIHNFYRRFWQHSCDHRGTPARPGLVVTLIKNDHKDVQELAPESTLGMVYDVDLTPELLKDLDFRERHGYMRTIEEVENVSTGEKTNAIVYYAMQGHDVAYAGPQTLAKTASKIANVVGPSGSNLEYFENIIKFMQSTGHKDEYLESIDKAVKGE